MRTALKVVQMSWPMGAESKLKTENEFLSQREQSFANFNFVLPPSSSLIETQLLSEPTDV